MRILDTHLHLIYQDRFSYPWLQGQPQLNRQWPVEAYFAEAAKLGIEAALHMEVDAAESDMLEESRFVANLEPRLVGAIAACRPEHSGFAAHLDALSEIKAVRGVRRILHQAPDELSQGHLFADNLRLLPEYGLSFDLCLRNDQLPLGTKLVDKCPNVQFVLDHCGNPDIAGGNFRPWAEHTTELARRPNIAVKISGIITNAAPDWTAEDLRPYVEHLLSVFGWDRVVWGSDHPVATLNGTLTRWVEATRTIIADASEEEQAKLLHRNAERIYRV